MHQNKLRTGLLALLLATGLLVFRGGAVAQESCASAQCHQSVVQAANVHAAAESCDTCHEATGAAHPAPGKKTFQLTQQQPDLCGTCHELPGSKPHVHAAVRDGACTDCHSPHSSEQPKLLVAPVAELCTTCHSDKTEFKVAHGPVSAGDCTACHTSHEADVKALLTKEGDALCFDCHGDVQELLQKKVVHAAVEMGCTSCHDPHGAEHPGLLAHEGPALCAQCHDAVAEKAAKAAVPHAAVESGCVSCHSPHASDHERLLPASEKETCLSCHGEVITPGMTVLHGPVADGKCSACHDPHGAQHPNLLVQEFPPDQYVRYSGTEFELCFTCHNRDLLQYADTSFATGFRDGDRNLHHLHVNDKQKGRSCALCHAVHGSGNPKLMADSVPFGKWRLPVKFEKTDTGGSCSPGCHRPLAYDREKPGRKPPR